MKKYLIPTVLIICGIIIIGIIDITHESVREKCKQFSSKLCTGISLPMNKNSREKEALCSIGSYFKCIDYNGDTETLLKELNHD